MKAMMSLIGILVMAVSTAAPVRGLEIVKDGKARAVIVVEELAREVPLKGARGKRPTPGVGDAMAAEVLGKWIEKMSGVKLAEGTKLPEGMIGIYVGKAAIAAGLKLDEVESATHEGVRVVCDGKK